MMMMMMMMMMETPAVCCANLKMVLPSGGVRGFDWFWCTPARTWRPVDVRDVPKHTAEFRGC
jgi:hypothetical protein